MPEATPAAAPAPNAAPPAATPPVTPPATGTVEAPKTQPPAQEPAQPDPAVQALEARAAALGRAKREAAAVQAQKERFAQREREMADKLKLADDYVRLNELKAKDPVKFLEEVGLKIGDVSKRYLEQSAGKTPEQVANEVYEKRRAEESKARDDLDAKAQTERHAKAREDAYAAARKQLETLASDATKYELSSVRPREAATRAFDLIVKYYNETQAKNGVGETLDFAKAIETVERAYEVEELPKLANSKKLSDYVKKKQVDDAEAAKKKPPEKVASGKEQRSVAPRNSVETEVKQSPQSKPLRRLMPRDVAKLAKELILTSQAARDN